MALAYQSPLQLEPRAPSVAIKWCKIKLQNAPGVRWNTAGEKLSR